MTARLRSSPRGDGTPVRTVDYRPPAGYALAIEIYPWAELRRRAGDVAARGFERPDFYTLLYLTVGGYVHIVDFEALACAPGTVIALRPGQVHHFGDLSGRDGWMLVFRAEALAGGGEDGLAAARLLDALPARLALPAGARAAVSEAFARMTSDAARLGTHPGRDAVNALLRGQLQALVTRLSIDGAGAPGDDAVAPDVLRRFRRYRELVEREFANWRTVAEYAAHLGCSEKSLARAARLVADRGAKEILSERIVLEAKRLLAHSALPVANIGYELGFDEPTNFVKFFRRETRLTPGVFRAGLRGR